MKIFYIALENIEQRYTPMMNNALYDLVDKVIYPEFNYPEVIETGQFLDVNKTIIFKSLQLHDIAQLFYKNEVESGDVFLVGDIFFPGIESIKYMSELQNLDVKIYAFNYAGRSDKTDFVRKLGKWADYSEQGYHEICDRIFVGSEFHKQNVVSYFNIDPNKVMVTGYIWDRSFVASIYNVKTPTGDQVIWPHRLSKEKGLNDLISYAVLNPKQKIVVTSCGNKVDMRLPDNVEYKYNLTKAEYYEELAWSKYYLSTAYQETFGYTLQEAIHFGCEIAVPNRACYPEMVPSECLYDKIENVKFHKVPKYHTEKWNNNAKNILTIITKDAYNSRR